MERGKVVDILFEFISLEFVVNCGDFKCVSCVLYVGIVEILHFQ